MMLDENGDWKLDISSVWPALGRIEHWVIFGLLMLSALMLFIVFLKLLSIVVNIIRMVRQPSIILELTPPAGSLTQARTTSEFFTILHGLVASKRWRTRIFGAPQSYSFEIVSSKRGGIRYLLRTPVNDASIFEQMIFSYMPDVQVRRHAEEYLPKENVRFIEFKQTGHFAFPLGNKNNLMTHDPIAYITGAMANLAEDESMGVQYVIKPTSEKQASEIRSQLLINADILTTIGGRNRPREVGVKLRWFIADALFAVMDGIGEVISPTTSRKYDSGGSVASRNREAELGIKPLRILSSSEQQLMIEIEQKVAQPLYRVAIRGFASGNNTNDIQRRVSGLRTAFSGFDVPGYQSIRAKAVIPAVLSYAYAKRLITGLRHSAIILSSTELADIYHFPFSATSRVDNVITSLSKTHPAPVSLKNNPDLDVLVGANVHHGVTTPIGLTQKERERHMYVVGGTGNGKTTLLEYQIIQDIQNGKGVAVIDPHGDLAKKLLSYIPESRLDDVIYFNPDDLQYPIAMNILELEPGLEGDDLAREKDRVTETIVSMFRKIFSDDDSGGHRIEYILRNAVHTALSVEGSTLFTLFNLLNDPKYRNKVTKSLQDETLKKFWKNEFGTAGDYQKVKMSGGVTAKIGRFLFSEPAKRVFGQPKSTIDFSDILDSGKILICNFSKGHLLEDTSELFGVATLAKLQLAALRRISQNQEVRRPYYVYVDEFQNFATKSFVQILSEARKFALFITMAQQSTSQQDDPQMVNTILANVGTVIVFRTANEADERALQPFFAPYLANNELANLPSYSYYIRIAAVIAQEPFTGITIVSGDSLQCGFEAEAIRSSRSAYAREYSQTIITPPPLEKSPAKKSSKKSLLQSSLGGQINSR